MTSAKTKEVSRVATDPLFAFRRMISTERAPTIIVAAITTVIKKQYLPSHILLPPDIGLPQPSMVLLEQIRVVNKSDLEDYLGCVEDEKTWRDINRALKKEFGLWIYKPDRTGDIRCLCPKYLQDYKSNSSLIIKRLDPFSSKKDRCVKCDGLDYDYIVYDKRRAFLQIRKSADFRTIGFESVYRYNPHYKEQSPTDGLCPPGGDME